MENQDEQGGKLNIKGDLLKQAADGDAHALAALFKQFVGQEETILEAYFLGKEGIWGFGRRSFGCVTDKKLATIRTGWFGEIVYQDGYIKDVQTGAIFQPSILPLIVISMLVIIPTFGIGLLLMPFISKLYYRIKKSGLLATVDVGIPIYMFTNRSKLVLVNRLWRRAHTQKLNSANWHSG